MSRVRTCIAMFGCIWLALVTGSRDVRADEPTPEASGSPLPNLLIVVLDAARADHFGAYGYDRATTPQVDAFASHATRYAQVRAEAPYTFLSTSSLFTGESPAKTGLGARSGGRVPASMELLAERARAAGYRTFGYSENPYVTHYFGLAQGFDVFEEAYPVEALRDGKEMSTEIDTEERLRAMADRAFESSEQPFLLYVHLLRPHNPYAPPAPFAGRFGSTPENRHEGMTSSLLALSQQGAPFDQKRIERLISLYDENLAYADSLFGGLLNQLEERGAKEETVVVLTSDHGEAFGEEGALLHSTQLNDAMLRVPMVVRVPGGKGGVDETPIQLADLGRGLFALVDGASPSVMGNLGELRPRNEPLISWTNAKSHKVSAWTPERELILDAKSRRLIRYSEFEESPESSAAAKLGGEGNDLAETLVQRVLEWTGALPRVSVPDTEIDSVRRAQLEALGYLQPRSGSRAASGSPESSSRPEPPASR